MKSTHKTIRFDYKKIEQKGQPREQWAYYGFHSKRGRLHIDTKRFKKIMTRDGTTEFLHDGMFKNRNTAYLIPKKIRRYDYKVNLLRDLISELLKDWKEEYKPIISKILSPEDVYERVRMDGILKTACSDDYDEIEVEARIEAFRRYNRYKKIIKSVYCSFINKICSEIDRFILIFFKNLGYSKKDFNLTEFFDFTKKLGKKKKTKKLDALSGYKEFNVLHKINNFLKHNTIESYKNLKNISPENVVSTNSNGKEITYENGMFAGDWIIIEENYIDNVLEKINTFFEEYCFNFLGEDIEESKRNYDDYFKNVFKEVKNLDIYFDFSE